MNNNQGIFITGTDTGVGKTYVTAMIVASLRASGVDAIAFKPVQTGCKVKCGALVPADINHCNSNCGIDDSNIDIQSPYRFRDACSPHLAAIRAGTRINPKKIIRCFNGLQKNHEVVVVEGAGGVHVPVCGSFCMIDLIKALDLPAIVVARAGLGTINHTLLTVEALRRRKIHISCIILNQPESIKEKYIITSNIETIEELTGLTVISVSHIPHE